jgi:peptidoglycan hydrolase-like protein with peptidoglycan-binding domain
VIPLLLAMLGLPAAPIASAAQSQAPATSPPATVPVAFLRGEQLARVPRPGRHAGAAVRALIAGPTAAEASHGYTTSLRLHVRVRRLTIRDGIATIDFDRAFASRRTDAALIAAVSQTVRTLSWFAQVKAVRFLVHGSPIQRTVKGIPLDQPVSRHLLATPNVPVPQPPPLRLPAPNPKVKAAQQRLIALRYLRPGDDDGRLGPTTSEGLLAFQKYEGLNRTGALDGPTRRQLSRASAPTPRTHGPAGKRAEVLLDRQVALLIKNNRVVRAIAVSTGKPSTPTPPGSYHIYAKIPRWWSVPFREWLPLALPFVGGIAFHEFPVVPSFPASHGCVRQPFAVAHWTYNFAVIGMPVRVLSRS